MCNIHSYKIIGGGYLDDEILKLEKTINDIDFYIWLFSRYKGKTAEYIVDIYIERREMLVKKYKALMNKHNGVDTNENI